MNKLSQIQSEVKAPKGQYNSFGKYKYRSCEDIVEAVKPVINTLGFSLILTDEMVQVGNRIYVKATASITDGKENYSAVGWAREEETKKGMDASQITGAASSYARKYALNGLFAIDDTKDADATNNHKEIEESPVFIAVANARLMKTEEDLKSYWDSLPDEIRNDKSFIAAVKERKQQLK